VYWHEKFVLYFSTNYRNLPMHLPYPNPDSDSNNISQV